jgi:hypothetical protein
MARKAKGVRDIDICTKRFALVGREEQIKGSSRAEVEETCETWKNFSLMENLEFYAFPVIIRPFSHPFYRLILLFSNCFQRDLLAASPLSCRLVRFPVSFQTSLIFHLYADRLSHHPQPASAIDSRLGLNISITVSTAVTIYGGLRVLCETPRRT